jgi:hypothetical protein
MFVNELSDNDMEQRVVACRALLAQFPNAVSRSRVLFSDECAIYVWRLDETVKIVTIPSN